MRVRRLLTAMITVGLVAPAAAVISTASTPASAAITTTIVPKQGAQAIAGASSPASFGDDLTADAEVIGDDGETVYGGAITVERLLAGESTWVLVATDTRAPLYYPGIKAEGNATYRITFTGYADYSPSVLEVSVQVQRKLTKENISGDRAGFKGTLSPRGKVKVTVMKKQGKKYTKFTTVTTSKRGKFKVLLPSPSTGRFVWRFTFAGDARFVSSEFNGFTY